MERSNKTTTRDIQDLRGTLKASGEMDFLGARVIVGWCRPVCNVAGNGIQKPLAEVLGAMWLGRPSASVTHYYSNSPAPVT